MKKALVIMIGMILLLSVLVTAGMLIPASDRAKEKAVAPDNSPVMDGDWAHYYVESDNPVLKAILGINHEFPKVFSTELTQGQVKSLNALGIKTEPVQIYWITGKKFPPQRNSLCY